MLGAQDAAQRANRPEQMYPDSGFGKVQHGRHVACRVSLELTQHHDCTLSRRKQIDRRQQFRAAFGMQQGRFGRRLERWPTLELFAWLAGAAGIAGRHDPAVAARS